MTYSDYGSSEDIIRGHGYNSEMMDSTGLIYLRARYYDPGISRFVQIDNNYDGEKESIATQNKYVYTLNNPYKYVDRNGNFALFKAIGNVLKDIAKKVVKEVTKTVKKVVEKVTKAISPTIAKTITKTINKVEKTVTKVVDGIGKNKATKKGGGSTTRKAEPRNIVISAKCPEKETNSGADNALNILQNVLDWIGWIPGLGDICDGINAAISFFRNNFIAALISIACMVFPLVAD